MIVNILYPLLYQLFIPNAIRIFHPMQQGSTLLCFLFHSSTIGKHRHCRYQYKQTSYGNHREHTANRVIVSTSVIMIRIRTA